MQLAFPMLASSQKHIEETIHNEENKFLETLDKGIEILEKEKARQQALKQAQDEEVEKARIAELQAKKDAEEKAKIDCLVDAKIKEIREKQLSKINFSSL